MARSRSRAPRVRAAPPAPVAAGPQRVLTLARRSPAALLCARRTVCTPGSDRPKCLTLPGWIRSLYGPGDVLDRHLGDRHGAGRADRSPRRQPLSEPSTARVMHPAAVRASSLSRGEPGSSLEAGLGGDHDPLAQRGQRSPSILVSERTVDLRYPKGRRRGRPPHAAARSCRDGHRVRRRRSSIPMPPSPIAETSGPWTPTVRL